MTTTVHPTVRLPTSWTFTTGSWRSGLIVLLVFAGGFVIREPAPYDLVLIVTFPLFLITGLTIARSLLPLIGLIMLYLVGGIIGLTQVSRWPGVSGDDAVMYIAITGYLAASSIFFAAVVAESGKGLDRLQLIFSAYTWSAVLTAVLGTIGYFGVVPGSEMFTRFGRAMGVFQDPNVFAPYLLLPLVFVMLNVFQRRYRGLTAPALIAAILFIGLFLSFSRGAWAAAIFCGVGAFAISFVGEPDSRARHRLIVILIAGLALVACLIVTALSIEQVRDLFLVRAQLIQSYDAGDLGRFGRMAAGFQLITERPLGLGATSFRAAFFDEEPHNMLLKAFVAYGWLGGISYLLLIVCTLIFGFMQLFRHTPQQIYLQAAYICLVAHVILSMVIDMDHWRHFFLLLGLVWGTMAIGWVKPRTDPNPLAGPVS